VYFFYILKKYLKNFLIVFIGLTFLFVVVDYIFNFAKLPSSSNLQVLYMFYMLVYSAFTLYPLALIFAFLLTLSSMIKFNELVSFYSTGFTPQKLIRPFLFLFLSVTAFMFVLQSTKLAYSNQYAKAIKENFNYKTYDLFLKYKDNVIYIKVINPFSKTAWGLKVFRLDIQNQKVKEVILAKKAKYRNSQWIAKNAVVIKLTDKAWISEKKNLKFLKNFTPKILSNLKSLDNISFYDAYIAIRYFKEIDLNMILSIVFFKIFTPASLLALMVLLFFKSPIHIRISNVTVFMLISVALSMLVWAVELMLFKFSKQGVLPYWSLAIPFFVILLIDFITLRRSND